MTDELKARIKARINAAIERIASGRAPMRVPADMNDPDLVLADCLAHLDGLATRIAELERERDELRQRILDSCPSPDEDGRIHAGGRIVCGQCHDSEVRHLTNERDAARAQVERARHVAAAVLANEWPSAARIAVQDVLDALEDT